MNSRVTRAPVRIVFKDAVTKADEANRLGLTQPEIFYRRGRWNFCAGNIDASMGDFDRYIKERPERANSQWERGITCYYANKYKAGSKQFEDYQDYHDNDVENAVWRYLCQMKFDGKKKARAAILPIKNDPRIPMMEIYRLFRGESTPENVLKVLGNGQSDPPLVNRQRFDTHLYLALYFDSEDDLKTATKHVDIAVQQFELGDYMWSVAVQHQHHLQTRVEAAAKEN